ncbi:efflux RND transporter periplasmic adaptor subunit [Candidatus Nitronereus thalassa]|uniref:Efflux RND transporter periplasmic adaptor subunit n=1 Tax=Candidatus Nitronereus thalassa TaxID=3020898 RepID=A0ABU3K9U8_9BACT|nr:efflux RND transporter periplasmic adaptor subunit [Candidatus Nitronereus thalassa]MDT7043161.1 efflux RND transporter periplasmic adaptor subunit [Candidatus Nitronereus thalassa]
MNQSPPPPNHTSKILRILLPILIVILAALGAQVLITHRPNVPKISPGDQATFVEVLPAHMQDERAVITAFGTVQAHQQVTVHPEVDGLVIQQSPDLVKGGIIPEDVALLQIDPRDYQFAVDEERAAVAKAEFDLKVEFGNQAVAQREWKLLNPAAGEISDLSKQLALRRPHLLEKQMALQAAKSRLAKARLDVQRTILTAPFNAMVLSESVEVGQLINTQSSVATLVGTDEFRAQVSVPIHHLDWISVPDADTRRGSRVRIIRDIGQGEPVVRYGRVAELLGDVTQNGRMAQVLVSIHDPLQLEKTKTDRRPLLLGEYVRVEIEGPILHNVIVLPRHIIREGSRVWVKNSNNQLEVRQVEILLSRKDSVVISQGVKEGEQIITSQLPAGIPGLLVKSAEAPSLPSPVSSQPESDTASSEAPSE